MKRLFLALTWAALTGGGLTAEARAQPQKPQSCADCHDGEYDARASMIRRPSASTN